MFVGHYAAALVATSADSRAKLWMTVAGCQLIDIGWGLAIVAGIEHARYDASLPFLPYVFEYMPWTHSLPAALIWSGVAYLLVRHVWRVPHVAALLVASTVFSHWLFDLPVHRADLALWPGGPRVGLGFWDYPAAAQAAEVGLLAIAAGIATAQRTRENRRAAPVVWFVALLCVMQVAAVFLLKSGNPLLMGGGAAGTFVLLAVVAAWVDRRSGAPAHG